MVEHTFFINTDSPILMRDTVHMALKYCYRAKREEKAVIVRMPRNYYWSIMVSQSYPLYMYLFCQGFHFRNRFKALKKSLIKQTILDFWSESCCKFLPVMWGVHTDLVSIWADNFSQISDIVITHKLQCFEMLHAKVEKLDYLFSTLLPLNALEEKWKSDKKTLSCTM